MRHSRSTAILRVLSLIVALTLLFSPFGSILPAAAAPPLDLSSASATPASPTPTPRTAAPSAAKTAASPTSPARATSQTAKASASTTSALPCGPAVPSVELPQYRTRTSRTYVGTNGAYQTVSCTGSINYQDSNGVWQPIDNTLVPSTTSGYALQNAANAFSALFPSSLSSTPISVSKGSAAVSFSLVGAGLTAPTTSGSSVTYTNVLPNVTAAYAIQNDGVKETLTLQNAAAPASYAFSVSASGLSAKVNAAGGIDFLDSTGVAQLSFAPPTFQDSAPSPSVSPASFSLTQVGSALTVSVAASPTWLASSSRVWPVVLDPAVTVNPSQDCPILGGSSANIPVCFQAYLPVGYNSSVGGDYRALLQFDVSAVPANVTILDGALQVHSDGGTGTDSSLVGAYPLQESWTSPQVTWDTRDETTWWENAGGTIGSLVSATTVSVTPGIWYTWGVAPAVQTWVWGTQPNDGVLLKEVNESITNEYTFDSDQIIGYSPSLTVTWQPWLGIEPYWTYASQPLTDRSGLLVNVANGNLVVQSRDLSIAGTGLPLDLERSYNSLSSTMSPVGPGWTLSLPVTPYLDTSVTNGVALYGPSGWAVLFPTQGGGTLASPAGLEATLVKNQGGTYTLTEHADGTQERFGVPTPSGKSLLTAVVDRNGNTISLAYNPDNTVQTITDTQNRTVTFTYTQIGGHPFLAEVADQTGRNVQYNYNPTSLNLTDSYDANGKHTVYHYNANGLLSQIDDPLGNQTKITYDANNRVSTIIRVTNLSQGTGPTTSLTYTSATSTTVHDPDTNATVDTYDALGQVTHVQDAVGNTQGITYNADNQVTAIKDAKGQITKYTYATDGTNNLLKVQIPTGASTSWTYTDSSHPYYPTSFTDAQGNLTTYAYDTAGNLHTITDQLSTQNQATINHNANGTVSSVVDFNLNTWSYGYDGKGNLTSITPPSTTMPSPGTPLGATTITPDNLSRPHLVVDGALKQTTTTYDNLDRPTLITYNDNSTISYQYDADGNVLTMTDGTGTTSYLYDPLNRKTQKTLPNATGTCPTSATGIVCYTYDNASNLLSLEDSTGTVTYGYNDLNEVTSFVEPPINGTSPQVTFGYDANHNRTTKTFPGNTVETTTFDNAQRPTEIKTVDGSTVLNDLVYTYNNGASDTMLTQSVVRSDNANDNSTAVNTYDALNRLTNWNVMNP